MSWLYAELTPAEKREVDRQENERHAALIASVIADSKRVKQRADLTIADGHTFLQYFIAQVRQRAATQQSPLSPTELAALIADAADAAENLEDEFRLAARAAYVRANNGSAAGFKDAWPALRAEILRSRQNEKAKDAGAGGIVIAPNGPPDRIAEFLAQMNGEVKR